MQRMKNIIMPTRTNKKEALSVSNTSKRFWNIRLVNDRKAQLKYDHL